jgi:predicted O-methyltransferase YrrM
MSPLTTRSLLATILHPFRVREVHSPLSEDIVQSRDTDRDWNELAKRDPYYAVLSHPRFSHADRDPERLKEFFESGDQWIEEVVKVIKSRLRSDFAPDVAVDFGCGVGRLMLPMARHCRQVVGIDVSEPMREIAAKNLKARNVREFKIFHSVEDLARSGVQADWINSFIVFQHIPPVKGMQILDVLLACLRHGGFVSLHLTFAKDRRMLEWSTRHVEHYRSAERTFEVLTEQNAQDHAVQSMYDHDLNHAMVLCVKHDIHEVWLSHVDHGGQHGVMLYGMKGSTRPIG